MYHFGYDEVMEESCNEARAQERRALQHAVELLAAAEEKGVRSREAVDALLYVNRLWSVLLEDLASPENELPEALRANLISIGLWVLKETENIRFQRSDNFRGVMEICEIIAEGLK